MTTVYALPSPPSITGQSDIGQALSENCLAAIDSAVAIESGSLNQAAAISLATGSVQMQPFAAEGKLSFSSISETWHLDATTCQLTLETVDVSFSLTGTNGIREQLTFREDPSISRVYNATNWGITSTAASRNWSGYVMNNGKHLTSAYGYWHQPKVSLPSQGCLETHCEVVFWVGLANEGNGANGIAQTGTDSGIYCSSSSSCSYYYYGWYEFFPDQPTIQACSMSVSVGDQVSGQAYEPTTSTEYHTVLIDDTTDSICSSSYNMVSTGVGYYGQFIGERPSYSSGYARLPVFTTTVFTSGYVCTGYTSVPTNCAAMFSFPYSEWTMINGRTQNIQNTRISTTSFSETWLSSSST